MHCQDTQANKILYETSLIKSYSSKVILYIRMGSFTSKPKVSSEENPDADLEFPPTSSEELLAR